MIQGHSQNLLGVLNCRFIDGYLLLDRIWHKYNWRESYRQRYSQYILLLLLLIGILYPTSWYTDISVVLRRSFIYLLNVLLFFLLILNGLGDRISYRCGLAIPVILFVATFFSSLETVTLGAYIYFLPISLIFFLNLKDIYWNIFLTNCFIIINIFIVVTGISVIFDVQVVENFLLDFYSAYRDNLLKRMLEFGKPVSFFSSHSIASFMYSILFYLNIRCFFYTKKIIHLLFALFYIVILLFLESNSAYYSFVILLLLGIYYVRSYLYNYKIIFTVTILSLSIILVSSYYYEISFFSDLYSSVTARFSNQGSGFIGRYSSHGVLAGNIIYIKENPFSPVGLCNSNQFWFMDSGIVEYMLRGSLLLVFVIYYGLFRFLRYHLPSRETCWILFIFVVINELGFPYLKYVRFMCLFPFIVVYLRCIELDSFGKR